MRGLADPWIHREFMLFGESQIPSQNYSGQARKILCSISSLKISSLSGVQFSGGRLARLWVPSPPLEKIEQPEKIVRKVRAG
jgi:hypothetical protein